MSGAIDRNLEVRVIPGVTDSSKYHWHIAIVGKWPIESSPDVYSTEAAAWSAGRDALGTMSAEAPARS